MQLSTSLGRLLDTLARPSLLRLSQAFRVSTPKGYLKREQLALALLKAPHVGPREIVDSMLLKPELERACAKLGLHPGGTRDQLAKRVGRSLRWRTFQDARAFVQGLGLKKNREWRAYSRGDLAGALGERPADLPAAPESTYAEAGWVSWGDFLGTGAVASTRRSFLPFLEARAVVRGLKLRGQSDWRAWLAGELPGRQPRSQAIPTNPQKVYRNHGWVGAGDWLGTGTVATRERVYWPYAQAKGFVRGLGLCSQTEWGAWFREEFPRLPPPPKELPRNPTRTYELEWESWGVWLGTGRLHPRDRAFLPYTSARRLSRTHRFETQREWFAWREGKRPDLDPCPEGMPFNPHVYYIGRGWQGWEGFLGSSYRPRIRSFRSFAQARKLVCRIGIPSSTAHKAWCMGGRPDLPERPWDVPTNPWRTYAEEWRGWGHYLGTGAVSHADRVYRPFTEARVFARNLGLKSGTEWRAWCGGRRPELPPRPNDVPAAPWQVYAADWQGDGDWLGTGNLDRSKHTYLPFEQARAFARTLGLSTATQWRAWHPRELKARGVNLIEVPSRPRKHYAQEWVGWEDWLGAVPSSRR